MNSGWVMGYTQIQVKRFRKAGDSYFLPQSPEGFIVAMMQKPSRAVTVSQPYPRSTPIVLDQSTWFSLSSTLSSAVLISSMSSTAPSSIASMTTPLTNQNLLIELGLRHGRRDPSKSEASVCLWQFMEQNLRPEILASSQARVVLPQPVSPTSRTAQLFMTALRVRAAILLKLLFIWTQILEFLMTYSLRWVLTTFQYSLYISRCSYLVPEIRTLSTNFFSSAVLSRQANKANPYLMNDSLSVNFLLVHFSRSLIVMMLSLLNTRCLCLQFCKLYNVFFTYVDSYLESLRIGLLTFIMAIVSSIVMSSKLRLMNRFLKALDRVLRPEYEAGFCVANILKFLWGLMCACCSGMNNYLLSSRSLLRHSRISVLARLSSSNISQWPSRTACTRGPYLKISFPSLSGKQLPRYSSISVCS